MEKHTDAQQIRLVNFEWGNYNWIAITEIPEAAGNPCLEIQNGSSENWTVDPQFRGNVINGSCVERVFAVSAKARISFPNAPGAEYWITVTHEDTGSRY